MEATPYFTLYLLYLSAFLLAYIVLDVYLKAEIYTFAKKIHGPKAYPIIGTNYVFYADKKSRRIIPAGCHMKIFVYDVHHQEKYWPDPRKFDPDRFLPENVSQRNRYSFLAFSDGPRNCLGKCKRATP
ncbi:unnamed protein product, partial [Callosobruchus maculatus]